MLPKLFAVLTCLMLRQTKYAANFICVFFSLKHVEMNLFCVLELFEHFQQILKKLEKLECIANSDQAFPKQRKSKHS